MLVGLQLPGILEDQDRSAASLIGLGLLAGGVVIGTRMVWLHITPYVIRALDRRPQQVERRVGWRPRTIIGWAGLRGAVSLAAALALPLGFPERDLLIWLTLCVIFCTLVLQGLTLPALIRFLDVPEDEEEEREELIARKAAARAALRRTEELDGEDWVRADSLDRMRRLQEFRYRRLAQRAGALQDEEESLDERSIAYQRLVREMLEAQRDEIVRLRDEGRISDGVLHMLLRELDLEDRRLEI